MVENNQKSLKEKYKTLDIASVNQKVKDSMLTVISSPLGEEEVEGYSLFEHIHLNFTHEELLYVACTYIAKELLEKLNSNPELLKTASMIAVINGLQQKK